MSRLEVHNPEPAYLEGEGPYEPERIVSMGVEQAEREAKSEREAARFRSAMREVLRLANSGAAWRDMREEVRIVAELALAPALESEARRGS